VQYGDTLSLLAQRYDVPLATLAGANDIPPPYQIRVGEILRIPYGTAAREIWPSPRRPRTTGSSLTPSAAWLPVQKPKPLAGQGDVYIVGPGESLARIASRHRLPLPDLVSVNGIKPPYRIYPGQRLVIPPNEETLRAQALALNEARRQQAIVTAPSPPLSADGFLWPVEGAVIRDFSENSDTGQSGAVNIAARMGSPVRATNNGIVAFVGKALDRYGQMVVVRHADDYVSLYAHNQALHVHVGELVRRGQVIADVGDTGDVGEGQLRFELRKGMVPIDPQAILAGMPGRTFGALGIEARP
jgi:murein DD-endopeptidase MepM/ murein hydrolase activator NlpD